MPLTRRQIYRRRRIVVGSAAVVALGVAFYLPFTLLAPPPPVAMDQVAFEVPAAVQPAMSFPAYGASGLGALGYPGVLASGGATGPLPIASISAKFNAALVGAMVDHDITTRWHCGREQRPGDAFTVDLGSPRRVNGAELLTSGFVGDFPRTLLIETSLDGEQWSQAWNGDGALLALSAALEDPLNVPMPFEFEPRAARYVRFTQLGADETWYWSVTELRIVGTP